MEQSPPARDRHPDRMVRLNHHGGSRSGRAAQELQRRAEHRAKSEMAMNDVLPPEPLPIVKDPRQQRRIGRSETSPRHEFGDNPVIQLARHLLRRCPEREHNGHDMAIGDALVCEVDDHAFRAAPGERGQDMGDLHERGVVPERRPRAHQ